MKKHLLLLLAAVAFLASSCSSGSDEAAVTDPVTPDGVVVTMEKPVIMAHTGLDGTRVQLAPDGKKVQWSDGDDLAVFLKGANAEHYILFNGAGTSSGQFYPVTPGEYTPGEFKHYVAVSPFNPYPIQENTDRTGYVLTGIFPDIQHRNIDNPYHLSSLMVAVSENPSDLKFKNVCGLLKLTFTADDDMTIDKIVVRGRNNELVSGNFKLDVGNDGAVSGVKFSDEHVKDSHITFYCDYDNNLEVGKYVDLYISMIPMDFPKGIEVTVSTNKGDYIYKTKPFTMKRSDILVMPELELSVKETVQGEITLITDEDAY